jgi:hypothetical protein
MPQQRPIGPAEYEGLVHRIHSVVGTSIPPGSAVLIVSKGDERLVDLGRWRGWHFPQDSNGRFPGYYPPDSDDAIRQLEQLRDKGADYFLIPSSSFWWLDHYREFAQHLSTHYQMVVRVEDTCVIYALRGAAENRLASFLDALLAEDATIAVVTGGDASLLALDRPASHFPSDADGSWDGERFSTGAEAAAALERLAEGGTRYLVVPVEAAAWIDRHPDFLAEVRSRFRRLAAREHLCTLFELAGAPTASERDEPPARAVKRGAGKGVLAKLIAMLPRGGEAGRGSA